MFLRFFVITCIFQFAICEIYLTTKLGRIKGIQTLSRDGKKFNAFLRIPFAQPPLGDLRFHDPVPITSWNGTLDATMYAPFCPQYLGDFFGQEDCLYLNLYTPFLPDKNISKLPILVWIYPGRRLFGDAQFYHYGPQYFMDKPVILITANYRLGIIGFFSTEDEASPGNYGLKDQSAVLSWIHDYVSDFGGDPSNVTLFGESSGAVDVSLHLFSPLSKGLVHKAISQSGQPMNFRTILPKGHSIKRAWNYAKIVKCDKGLKTSEQLVKCLRNISVEELTMKMFSMMYDYVFPHTFFGPVIEHKTKNAFLTNHPVKEFHNANYRIPWLLGIVTDEGSQKTLGLSAKPGSWNHIVSNYERIFPELFGYEYLSNAKNITNVLLRRYIGDTPLIQGFKGISKIFGFGTVQLGSIESARHYRGPTYFYHFDHLHEIPYVRVYEVILKLHTKEKTGVIHGEEIRSLFQQTHIFPPVTKGVDRYISNMMINFWYNFAAHGNPNGNGPQIWKAMTTSKMEYLYIGSERIAMKTQPLWDEYMFWKNLGNPPLLVPQMLSNSTFRNYFN